MGRTKRMLAVLLAMVMVFAGLPMYGMEVRAAESLTEGDYEYEVNEDGNSVTITKYTGGGGDVTIPSEIDGKKVTELGEQAFSWCESITGITLPRGLENIGSDAFSMCRNLMRIILPEKMENIGNRAFYDCQKLTNISIPDGLKSIGKYAFSWCTSLTGISIPKGVESIGTGAFQCCFSLTNLEVDSNNSNYLSEDGILYDKSKEILLCCVNGKSGSIDVPEGVKRIEDGAFCSCANITSIIIPAGVTNIGKEVFVDCRGLEKLVVNPGNANYLSEDDILYDRCKAILLCCPSKKSGNLVIPEGITSIGENAFSYSELTNVTIPEGVTSIGERAFFCSRLENVSIPKGMKTIGESAFSNSKLTNVNIPEGVESIGNAAFSDCSSLRNISIPKGVINIGCQAFLLCSSLRSIVIPEGITSIEMETFSGCSSLRGIVIPEEVVSIEDDAFCGCDNLTIYGKKSSYAQNYANEKNIQFSIEEMPEFKLPISLCQVTISPTFIVYNGKPQTPSVAVMDVDTLLTEGIDYTVEYSDNINVGTAKVTVTGKGNYTGSKTVNFTITKTGQDSSITCKKTLYKVAYGAKPFKINAMSKSRLTFTSAKPKIVSVDKNTGKVTIKGTGVAAITVKAGTKSVKVTVKVSPKKQTVKSVKASNGKKLTVKWAKDKMASGYQVQISAAKNFKKDVKSKNVSRTSYTFTKLKTGKKYYVRVRSYKKSGKETLYGEWSKVKQSRAVGYFG